MLLGPLSQTAFAAADANHRQQAAAAAAAAACSVRLAANSNAAAVLKKALLGDCNPGIHFVPRACCGIHGHVPFVRRERKQLGS